MWHAPHVIHSIFFAATHLPLTIGRQGQDMTEIPKGPGNPHPETNLQETTETIPAVTHAPDVEATGAASPTAESRSRWRWPAKTRNRIAASVASPPELPPLSQLSSPVELPPARTPPDSVKVTTSRADTLRRRLSVKAPRRNRFGSSPKARVPQDTTVSSSLELRRHLWPVPADTDQTCRGRANHFTPTRLQLR